MGRLLLTVPDYVILLLSLSGLVPSSHVQWRSRLGTPAFQISNRYSIQQFLRSAIYLNSNRVDGLNELICELFRKGHRSSHEPTVGRSVLDQKHMENQRSCAHMHENLSWLHLVYRSADPNF